MFINIQICIDTLTHKEMIFPKSVLYDLIIIQIIIKIFETEKITVKNTHTHIYTFFILHFFFKINEKTAQKYKTN